MSNNGVSKLTVWSASIRATMPNYRRFYVGIAIAFMVVVFVGFAPTYYLKFYFLDAPLRPLVHLHGIVFTAWIVLVFAQTVLVARRQVDMHRRLGMAGALLAVLMVVVGVATNVAFARRNLATLGPAILRPFTEIFVFAILSAAGILYRHRPEVHKRLMLLATIALLHAAIGRIDILQAGRVMSWIATDLFVVACLGHDLLSRGRVHPAYIWGGTFLVFSQLLRYNAGWMAFLGKLLQ
jgi:hypothetical protein